MATCVGTPEKTEMMETRLKAVVGRLVFPGGLTAATRHAGAEPLMTGRPQPYDESTLRVQLRKWAKGGGSEVVARQVERQVEKAVEARGVKVSAHTDMHDQAFYTKLPAHAGPVGRLGNKILGVTYFAVTTIELDETGPALAYSLSWHKPASPLGDGLVVLHANPRRHAWLSRRIRLHTLDRGGNGRKLRRWALGMRIPYLTLSGKKAHWTRYKHPTLRTAEELPVMVIPDKAVRPAGPKEPDALEPTIIVFPAHPEKREACTKAIKYETAAKLSDDEKKTMDKVYKRRWRAMENVIKHALAVGFGINRDRKAELTTSRGVDGKLTELDSKEAKLLGEIEQLGPTRTAVEKRKVTARKKKLGRLRMRRAAIKRQPLTKRARMPTGGELLCKNLMMLTLNALALILAGSPLEEVRTMTPLLVRELLLGRTAWARVEKTGGMTLWVEPVNDARQRDLQDELVRIFDRRGLTVRGHPLRLRVQKRICDPPFPHL